MKEFINYMADPIRSFPIFTALFFLMIKYIRVFGSMKFGKWSLILSLPVIAWFCADPNFLAIVLWPDNIPIVILIATVSFLLGTLFTRQLKMIRELRLEKFQ